MKTLLQFAILFMLTFATGTWAGDVTIPHAFTANTTAVAADVNENFSAIETAVNDNHSKINTNGGDVAALQALIASLELRLAGLEGFSHRKVALITAEHSSLYRKDAQSKILGVGRIGFVDLIDARFSTPTLEELISYDAVLVWSNGAFASDVSMGDVLADYIDQGGGVVLAVFANTSSTLGLQGRFQTDNYFVISPAFQTSGIQQQLVKVDPGHPLLNNVNSFDGSSRSYQVNSSTVEIDATIVATWTGGNILVATKEFSGTRRVDLGFFPPSSDMRADFWDASTDGDVLMSNALLYVMGEL